MEQTKPIYLKKYKKEQQFKVGKSKSRGHSSLNSQIEVIL